jgi:SAM-dependent methyltransferase
MASSYKYIRSPVTEPLKVSLQVGLQYARHQKVLDPDRVTTEFALRMKLKDNLDLRTVEGFGDEWSRFDQAALPEEELKGLFNAYFRVFPWERLPAGAVGFDLGCGSGRWAKCVAPRVGRLHCIDASPEALGVARRNLAEFHNCELHLSSVDRLAFAAESMDFGYSLGVLHHVPDTAGGIAACTRLLKPGAPLLLYLYYAFDNQPPWYRLIWSASDLARRAISRSPLWLRFLISQVIAVAVYYPVSRISLLLEKMGKNVGRIPLSAYRHLSLYTMRTDALDRFGTRLEQRFTAVQIRGMMEAAGLDHVHFCDAPPYWCAVGYRKTA